MPKNRSTVFTVVREEKEACETEMGASVVWYLQTIPGVYLTLQRAEEVCSAYTQALIDVGMNKDNPDYRFTVVPSTFYDE